MRTSFWLWIATAVVMIVIAIIGATRPVDVSTLPATEQPFAAWVPLSGAIGGVIGGLLHVLFAIFLLRGKNWARVVLTVLAALTLIGLAINVVLGDWISLLALVLTVVAGVLMYLPASNPFFRR